MCPIPLDLFPAAGAPSWLREISGNPAALIDLDE
jgi:hypothetical protein